MKYQNGKLMADKVILLGALQNTRGDQSPKPFGETDYVKALKERINKYIEENTLLKA